MGWAIARLFILHEWRVNWQQNSEIEGSKSASHNGGASPLDTCARKSSDAAAIDNFNVGFLRIQLRGCVARYASATQAITSCRQLDTAANGDSTLPA
jgi:hypothetical protein